jgi:hypothetical protein
MPRGVVTSVTSLAAALAVALALTGAAATGTARGGQAAPSAPLLGAVGDLARFDAQTGEQSSVGEAFLSWGQGQTFGAPFGVLFASLGTVPMIELGTDAHGHEAITPGAIAAGKGDSYLLALNHAISAWGRAIYVRPLAEMNNAENDYSGFSASGQARGPAFAPSTYRKAFARIYVLLHGGSTAAIDAKLAALGLPPLQPGSQDYPNPFPTLRIIWSPLASDNPDIPANAAEQYYPGASYVDVEGGDIYDEQLTDTAPWPGLEALYQQAVAHHKPFSVPEWGLAGVDDPTFVRHMCSFLETHRLTEASVYYTSQAGSRYDLGSKPESRQAYQACLTPLAGPLPTWVRPAATLVALSLVAHPQAGAAPLAVALSIRAQLSAPIVEWQLLFGDGTEAAGAGPPPATLNHAYAHDGSYQPVLFVYRGPPFAPGSTPFFTATSLDVGAVTTSPLSLVETPGSRPLSISIRTELHLPSAASGWMLIWGDGVTEVRSGRPPDFAGHTFSSPGTYRVLLIVTATGGHEYAALVTVRVGAGGAAPPPPPPTTTTTTPPTTSPGFPPATGVATGTVLVAGKPFKSGPIPPGATINVTHGDFLVTTTTGRVHLFGSGVSSDFRLLKGRSGGKRVVVVELVGGNFAVCGTTKGKRTTAGVVRSVAKNTTIRQLWGNGKGNFETQGRYAAATVRGTYWLTRDTCDGTLVVVKRGVVAVFDKLLRKTVLVRAGHSFLAQ